MKFKDACARAVKFLGSPEFAARVEEEDPTMTKHIPILQKINAQGFLTFDSQAGRCYRGLHYETKKPYETKERAYICGFMLEKVAAEFIKQLGIHTDKVAIFVPSCDDYTNIPAALDVPVSITTSLGKIRVDTHLSSAMNTGTFHMLRKQSHIDKSEKVVMVFCWDTEWCRSASGKHGLFTDVLEVLKKL